MHQIILNAQRHMCVNIEQLVRKAKVEQTEIKPKTFKCEIEINIIAPNQHIR